MQNEYKHLLPFVLTMNQPGKAMFKASALIVGANLLAVSNAGQRFESYSGETLGVLVAASAIGTIAWSLQPQYIIKLCKHPTSLVTPALVHTDAKHFIADALGLCLFWQPACESFSVAQALSLVFGASVLATTISKATVKHSLTLGSSTGVASLISGVLSQQDYGPLLAPFGAVGLVLASLFLAASRRHPNVDHISHAVGALYGLSYGLLSTKLKAEQD